MRALLRILSVLSAVAASSAGAEPRHVVPDRLGADRLGVDRAGFDPRPIPTRRLSVQEAVSRAQRQHGGRVLAVDQDHAGGYRVKLLKDGEVRTVFITP